jgi:glycine/D-amino acid oxidase-like deaminating enzyme
MAKSNPINSNSGERHSLWMEVRLPNFPHLDENLSTDVCIVGGGIAGLTSAYTLAKQGKSVIVIDQGAIGGGQTALTTAHLSWVLDGRFYQLGHFFGQEGARLAAQSHAAAIDYIEKIVQDEKIDCDFERVDGYLFTPLEDSKDVLEKEYQAIKSLGMPVNKKDRVPFSSTFDTGLSLQFPAQAQFHILKYLEGLTKVILRLGGKIFSHTHISDFKDGSPCLVKTSSGARITAKSIIVGTCTPVNNRFFIHSKQPVYRTYAIAAAIPKDSVPKGLYWDTCAPCHAVRIQKHLTDSNLDWLIVGCEDHRVGQDPKIDAMYEHLIEWTKLRFKKVKKVEFRWSGQGFEPIDSLAFIGRNPNDKNIYIATGDSGKGITHGTIAGLLIPDLIQGKSHPWKNLYDPSRKTLAATSEFIKENVNVAMPYAGWLTPGEIQKIETLSPDEGLILREGVKKVAV